MQDVVKRMLVRDPAKRATAKDVLRHEWVREDGVAGAWDGNGTFVDRWEGGGTFLCLWVAGGHDTFGGWVVKIWAGWHDALTHVRHSRV